MFLGNGAPMICVINDVIAEAETWVESGTSNVSIEILEVYGDGEIAYQVGTYSTDHPQDEGTVKTFKGKHIVIFHRQDDGSWKIHASIQNSDSE
jgi:ketosteroid isomerase-like protein